MKMHEWPILVTQITSDPADYVDNMIKQLDGVGVLPNNHLRGLVQNINSKCNVISTIFEYNSKTDELARTTGFYGNKLINKFCIIAESLYQEHPIIEKTIKKIFNSKNKAYSEDYTIINIEGYQFLFAPIKCEEHIVAVLFSSDVTTSKLLTNHTKSDSINNLKSFANRQKLTLPTNFNKGKIKNSVISLQKLIESHLLSIRINFINYHNREFTRLIRKTFAEKNLSISGFWRQIEEVLRHVINVFPAKALRIFTSEIITKDSSNNYYLVASTIPREVNQSQSNTLVKIDKTSVGTKIQTSITSPSLLESVFKNGQRLDLDSSKDLVRIFPAPFASNGALIIWINYDKTKWDRLATLNQKNESEEVFQDLIVSLYSFISSLYTSLISNQSLQLLKKINKIDAHELANLSMALELNRVLYLGSITQRNRLTPERFEILNDNFLTLIRQLKLLSDLSKNVINNDLDPKKELFYPFGELLFKWKNLYHRKCLRKKNKILFPDDFKNKYRSPKYYGDQIMIEAIIYNLLENAYKYSYRGSNITVDYFYEQRTGKFVFSFINYSAQMSESRVIYKLFERGTSDLVKKIDGLGVGLFLCQKIAEAHGGTISHKTDKLSDYNIPLLERFINIETKTKKRVDLLPKIIAELKRIKENGIYKDVLSTDNLNRPLYRAPEKTIYRNINIPTYKIEFKILLK